MQVAIPALRFRAECLLAPLGCAAALLTLGLAAPAAAQPPDEVVWTLKGPTAVTVTWRGASDQLRYGFSADYDRVTHGAPPSPYPISTPGPFWEARLTGLRPNTVYHYSVGGGPDHTFRTPPLRGTSDFVVAVQGDIGDSDAYPQVAGVQALIAAMGPRFVLPVGDLTYANDHGPEAIHRHFVDVMAWSQDAAYLPSWGNHDWDPPDDLANYKGRLDLPNPRSSPNSPDAHGEDWYWFDYGNVRFIAYPEPWSGAWSDWRTRAAALMDSAQADPAIRFIVTFGHRPAYSSGHHGGSGTLRGYLDALGAAHSKYVLNLCGHSHNYERTHPQSGVIHVTAGTGGGTFEQDPVGNCLWKGGCPPPSWSAARFFRYGPVRLRFTGTGIRGEMICGPGGDDEHPADIACASGAVIDSFVIGVVDRSPVIAAAGVVTTDPGVAVTVPVAASDPDGQPLAELSADFSELPPGHGAQFVADPGAGTGSVTWTPGTADGHRTHFVTLRAVAGGQTSAATLAIRVTGPDAAPVVSAPASASGIEASPIVVEVTAADPDGDDLASLTADLSELPVGHGASFTPNPARTAGTLVWTPGYAAGGRSYRIAFTAANARSGSAEVVVEVANLDRAPTVMAPGTLVRAPGEAVRFDVAAGDPDGDAIDALTLDDGTLPASEKTTFYPHAGMTAGHFYWLPSAGIPDGLYALRFTAANARSGSDTTWVRITRGNRPPSASLQVHPPTGTEPFQALADASGSTDPDGDPLTYRFDFGDGAAAGPQGPATAAHEWAAGTWLARVTVHDGLDSTTSHAYTLRVDPNLATNGSFENGLSGWGTYSGSSLALVAGGRHGASAVEVRGPATTGTFGLNDTPNWVPAVPESGARYRYSAWVRSATSAASVRLRVREFQSGTQIGPTVYSPSVAAGSAWQPLQAEIVTARAGTSLDFHVLDGPSVRGETFQVDQVAVVRVQPMPVAGIEPAGPPTRSGLEVAPHPIRSRGWLAFSVTRAGPVRIGLHDVQGREVRRVFQAARLEPGRYRMLIEAAGSDGRGLSAGVYFCRVETAGGARVARVAIVP